MKQPGSPEPLLIISSSPHLHCGSTVSAAMRDVLLALVPTLAAAVYYFGTDALSVIAFCWRWCPRWQRQFIISARTH